MATAKIILSKNKIDWYYQPKPTAIVVDGPFANANRFSDYDEFPEWTVTMVDDNGEPVGKVYTCRSYGKAADLGYKMARDRKLEFINEASPSW